MIKSIPWILCFCLSLSLLLPGDSISGSLLEERVCGLSRISKDHTRFNCRGKQRTPCNPWQRNTALALKGFPSSPILLLIPFQDYRKGLLLRNPFILELVWGRVSNLTKTTSWFTWGCKSLHHIPISGHSDFAWIPLVMANSSSKNVAHAIFELLPAR